MNDALAVASKIRLSEWIPAAEGWLTVDRANEMYDLVRQIQPQYVVEIGVFGGRSLIAQAMALRDNGRGKIIGIDPWKRAVAVDAQTDEQAAAWWRDSVDYYKIHQGCMDAIWTLDLDRFVTIIRSTSKDCVDIIPMCDIIYIDGGHSEASSCEDVSLYLPKVKQNGWIWFDDADWKTTQAALGMIDQQCKLVRDCTSYRLYCKK